MASELPCTPTLWPSSNLNRVKNWNSVPRGRPSSKNFCKRKREKRASQHPRQPQLLRHPRVLMQVQPSPLQKNVVSPNDDLRPMEHDQNREPKILRPMFGRDRVGRRTKKIASSIKRSRPRLDDLAQKIRPPRIGRVERPHLASQALGRQERVRRRVRSRGRKNGSRERFGPKRAVTERLQQLLAVPSGALARCRHLPLPLP
jgi:hypothetical protein